MATQTDELHFTRRPSFLKGGTKAVFNIPPEIFRYLKAEQHYEVTVRPIHGSLGGA